MLKPIDEARMRRAIGRVVESVASLNRKPQRSLWVPYRGSIVPLTPDQIERVEAERDYVRIFDANRSYLLRTTLTALIERLDDRFLRFHRSKLIHRDSVAALKHTGAGSWVLVDHQQQQHAIGRTYRESVRKVLGM